jgi:hypothetical protein
VLAIVQLNEKCCGKAAVDLPGNKGQLQVEPLKR